MIEIDLINCVYTCPYCGAKQSYNIYSSNFCHKTAGFYREENNHAKPREEYGYSLLNIYHILCCNKDCNKVSVIAFLGNSKNDEDKRRIDILPAFTYKHFPDYIPQQIRDDYKEAVSIIDLSPKAAATLLRRCLQGMIHDFWGIKEKNLNAEITALKDKVPATQWKAIDGLRKIGNIGAHMESNINTIIDIEADEAHKLQKLIELLLDNWYISRHEEEILYSDIVDISEDKQVQRKDN